MGSVLYTNTTSFDIILTDIVYTKSKNHLNIFLCSQCLSPLTLWGRIPLRRGVLDTTRCEKVCQWLATGRWFFAGIPISPTNKTDRHDITEILLKVALNTIILIIIQSRNIHCVSSNDHPKTPSAWFNQD